MNCWKRLVRFRLKEDQEGMRVLNEIGSGEKASDI